MLLPDPPDPGVLVELLLVVALKPLLPAPPAPAMFGFDGEVAEGVRSSADAVVGMKFRKESVDVELSESLIEDDKSPIAMEVDRVVDKELVIWPEDVTLIVVKSYIYIYLLYKRLT